MLGDHASHWYGPWALYIGRVSPLHGFPCGTITFFYPFVIYYEFNACPQRYIRNGRSLFWFHVCMQLALWFYCTRARGSDTQPKGRCSATSQAFTECLARDMDIYEFFLSFHSPRRQELDTIKHSSPPLVAIFIEMLGKTRLLMQMEFDRALCVYASELQITRFCSPHSVKCFGHSKK